MAKVLNLTSKQKKLLNYLKTFIALNRRPPRLKEVAEFLGSKYLSTARFHLKALEKKNLIKIERGAIEIPDTENFVDQPISVRFLGYISAGKPFLTPEFEEFIRLDTLLFKGVKPSEVYILKARGNSMIEENIFDGDYLIVKSTNQAKDGDTVVATLNSESTIKKFYRYKDKIVLKPANKEFETIIVSGDLADKFQIQGVVIGLVRDYNFNK